MEKPTKEFELFLVYQAADRAWNMELLRIFGMNATSACTEPAGQGEPDTVLRALYTAKEAARAAWRATTKQSNP